MPSRSRHSLTWLAALIATAAILGAWAASPGPAFAAGLPLNVNDTRDRVDSNVGDGLCRTSQGTCTLRAAIQEANAQFGHDTINVPAGVYELEIPSVNQDTAGMGDYDLTDTVTISGAGPNATILDAGNSPPGSGQRRGMDRLFEVHPSAGDVTVSGLTVREGYAAESGGAILNWSPGRVLLDRVHVLDSFASKAGGGINNADPREWQPPSGQSWDPPETLPGGRVELVDSKVSGNAAGESGAGINNAATGTVIVRDGSRVVDNPGEMLPNPADPPTLMPAVGVYDPAAGAIANQADDDTVGHVRIFDSVVSRNYSTNDGAGILNDGHGTVTVERSQVNDNFAEGEGGGIFTRGGTLSVAESEISRNKASAGGGIHSEGEVSNVGLRPRFDVQRTEMADNEAFEGTGGGINNAGDTQTTMADVVFTANETVDAGGGLNSTGGTSLVLVRGLFEDNTAVDEGGGAYVAAERTIRIEDSEFHDNTAGVPGEDGNDAGGGGLYSEGGRVDIRRSKFIGNSATEEGGGVYIDNHGDVTVTDTLVRDNHALHNGGGIENSGMRVVFERVTVDDNVADEEGGGIFNSSSGEFSVLDSTIKNNRAVSGGGFTNASDSTLIVRGSLFLGNVARRPSNAEDPEDKGLGGGILSISDGAGLIENTTLSGNRANVGGGGIFHDADAGLRMSHVTVTRNSAPLGSGIGVVESDFVPSIPPQPQGPSMRNSIVAGNRNSPDCDAMLNTEGGNLDGGTDCMFTGPRDRSNSNPRLDAIADNGGPTLTHALREDSLAVDRALSPCPETDQRGVKRPQNRGCDVGAFEYEGPVPDPDETPPDTEYLSGPIQDSLVTMAFHFTGSDETTPTEELAFECRVVEHDLFEEPEIPAPWDPIAPELMFVPCTSGWQVPLLEEMLYTFEVRAIDKAGNVDPTPAIHHFSGWDTQPPETKIVEHPPNPSFSRAATFSFTAEDNMTPPEFMEYECRLDSRDPDHWLECTNPAFYSNLTVGEHTFEVRASDAADNMDRTPARYTWTIREPENCDVANVTLTASADGWVDETLPTQNFMFDQELVVRSGPGGTNARALFRFPLIKDAPDCKLESATLRLHAESSTPGRTLEAVPLSGTWRESQLTWLNQPGTWGQPARTSSGNGYREWNVLSHVETMMDTDEHHGWVIRDANENDPEGGEQEFGSREVIQDPPDNFLPQLELRYEADGGPPPPPPAEPAGPAKTVHCGEVLRESTLVGNDLSNCPNEGLVIGAPNIVVDLDGHTIDGPDYLASNQSGQEEGMPAGIRNSGHTNVVIRNGTVQQFGYGVLLTPGTTRTVVENVTLLRHALAGAHLADADDGRNGNTIQDSTIGENEVGVEVFYGTENNVIRRNSIYGNLGEAVHLHNSRGNRIADNQMSGIPVDPLFDSDGGMLLEGSSNNVITGNTVHDTGDAGVGVYAGSHGNRIESNVMYRNGDAGVIAQDSDRTQVIDLTSHQQSDGGVVLNDAHDTLIRDSDLRFNPSGVESSGSDYLVIEETDVSHSLGAGIDVEGGFGLRITDNVAKHTRAQGISIEGATYNAAGQPIGGAVIERNTANQNLATGIDVSEGGHRVANNDAHNNAGHGIHAEADVVDGGGNRASGNAEPQQCVNVVCDVGLPVALEPPDTTAPETIIVTHPASATTSTSATFTFTSTDAGTPETAMRYECRLDPGPDPEPPPPDPTEPPEIGEPNDPPDGPGWAECTSPIHFHDLDPGEHRFEVRALDQADNRDRTPAVYEWTIDLAEEDDEDGPDTISPQTRISSAPGDPSISTTATFRFAGSDNATPGLSLRFQCRLDSDAEADFEPCTSPKSYEDLDLGTHTFEVRAVDRTGNVDPTPASHTWTVTGPAGDTTPPDTTIDSGPDRVTVKTTARFTFSADEGGATFECSLDGADFASCTSPKEYSGLSVGEHEVRVRAVDEAGNEDPTPATYQWTVGAAPVPTMVFCGQTLTRSTLVLNDLSNCLMDGLKVGAHGITVDLGGRTLDGVGLGAGVRNDGFDDVTVTNGTLREFDYGVSLNTGTERNIAEQLRLEANQEAAIAAGMPVPPEPNQTPPAPVSGSVRDNDLRDNHLLGNKRGFWLNNGTRGNQVRRNVLGATDGPGVWLETATNNRVAHNEVGNSSGTAVELRGASGNVVADNVLTDSDKGAVLIGLTVTTPTGLQSNNNRVERNEVDEGGNLEIYGSVGNHLVDNTITGHAGTAIYLENARESVVRGNDAAGNKAGISLKGSTENLLEANNASRGDSGIKLEGGSVKNVLLRNTVSDTQGDGISIGDETAAGSANRIEGNRAHNNKGRGIYVGKPSHVIKDNSANDNGSWGIWVSDASNGRVNLDAGGNRAQGNVGPFNPFTQEYEQCYNVRCDGSGPADQTPPTTTLIDTPPATTTDDVATFRFTGSDNLSSVEFQCRLDAAEGQEGGWEPCTSPHTVTVEPGEHTFEVRAVDIAGNADPTPAAHTWVVQAPPPGAPDTTITSGPDRHTVSTSATLDFRADRRNVTFECALNNVGFVPCDMVGVPSFRLAGPTPPVTLAGLPVGTHEFRVRARSASGEVDPTPATWVWTIGAAPVETEIDCGEVVTQSIRVLNDINECPGHGLVIGASRITIDLDGHTIDGRGLDAGILNPGNDYVTITNGTVQEFDYGVMLAPGTAGNVVSEMRLQFNQDAGMGLSDAEQGGLGNRLRSNTIASNGYGVLINGGTTDTLVKGNALGGNRLQGVRIEFSNANRIEDNEIATSGGAAVVSEGGTDNVIVGNEIEMANGAGIAVGAEEIPSDRTIVENNTVSGTNGGGISVINSNGSRVLFNEVHDSNGAGVLLELSRNAVVRANDLRGNKSGVELSGSNGNRVESNNTGESLGVGISIVDASFGNAIVLNASSSNSGEGIHVIGSAPSGLGNLLERNIANQNGGNGISVEGAGHTLTANTAMSNGGWGIYAPAGAIDGGGNTAGGNAEGQQCLGVTCGVVIPPGSPETEIVTAPSDPSNSRNASFTYTGWDDNTPLWEMQWECRLDSTSEAAWEDCEYPQEYLNLLPGQHTFEVRAIDRDGNVDPTPARYTWTYEPLPAGRAPVTTIDIKPDAETWWLEALFTFHADEPDVTFQCRVDNNPYVACGFQSAMFMSRGAFEWEFEDFEVGMHRFQVRAIDFEGNVGEPATYEWRILGVVTEFLSGPGFTPGEEPGDPATGGPVQDTTATIDFRANVADATFLCSLDLGPFEPCTPPVTYTNLAPGEHSLRVIAIDENGVEAEEYEEYEWEVVGPFDNTPPDTFIERAPANGSSSTIFEFTGVDDMTPEARLRFQCRLDSNNPNDWFDCESPLNLLDHFTYSDSQMAPGQHTFEVRAIDDFDPLVPDPMNPEFDGNADPTPATYTWTSVADTTPPGTGISVAPPARTGEIDFDFEFFGVDNATPGDRLSFECSVDDSAWEACDSPESVQGLEPGTHTFRVRAIDLLGNVDPTPATHTWEIVDAPTVTVVSGPPAEGDNEQAIFEFNADQAGSTFECSYNGSPYVACTSPYMVRVRFTGQHKLEIRATNPEGVTGPELLYEWRVALGEDTHAPETMLTGAPSPISSSPDAVFRFTGSDNRTDASNLKFECSLDGAPFEECASPHEVFDLGRGEHVFLVAAVDQAGNIDPTPAEWRWTIAGSPPRTTIISGPEDPTESTEATFVFESDVPGSTFTCWMNGVLEPNCESPKTYTNLAPGEYLFAVYATDPTGINERDWVEYEWEVGVLTAPPTTIHSGPELETESTEATFTFSSPVAGATFECSLNGEDFRPCTSGVTYRNLAVDEHEFEVQAVVPGMLVDPEPVRYEWSVVDNTPPETEIDFGPQNGTSSTTARIGFSSDDPFAEFQCSLDGTAFSSCESPAEYTDLARTSHTFLVRAVDQAGNVDPTPAVHQWTIGPAPPPNTFAGTDVTVTLPMPDLPGREATVNFAEVTVNGTTILDRLIGAPPLPSGYSQAGAGYYELTTTADYSEPVTVCLAYDPASLSSTAVRLLELDGNTWTDITVINDRDNSRVCGEAEELTAFAVATAGAGVAPLVTILSGPPALSTSGSATFTFEADRADAALLCSIDGQPFEACSSPATYNYLETGDHTFEVMGMSLFGFPGPVARYEWDVELGPDTTPPNTTITRPANNNFMTTNFLLVFEFAGVDDQTHPLELDYECSLDGGPWESCSSPEEIEVETAGEHHLEVRAVDEAGNADPTPASRTWTVVDLRSPDTEILSGPDSETSETTATFTFEGETPNGDPVFEFDCRLDSGSWEPCTSPHTIQNLSAGPHFFQVRARDAAGNVDWSPDTYEWIVTGPADTTPPETFFITTPAAVTGPDVTFVLGTNEWQDPELRFECSLDGTVFEECEELLDLDGLSGGQHTLRARAIDGAGNVDASPASFTWTVVGPPQTTITSAPPARSESFSATFEFTSNYAGATFECSFQDSGWVPCESPHLVGPLAGEGDYEFRVRAVTEFTYRDGQRVVDESPAVHQWTFDDVTPPETGELAVTVRGADDLEDPNTLEFRWTGTDNTTLPIELDFECRLVHDGTAGAWEGCSSPHMLELEELAPGAYTFQVRAIDEYGNTEQGPYSSYSFEIPVAPVASIVSGPPAQSGSTSATFEFAADTPFATYECSLNQGAFEPCSSPVTFTDLPLGENILLVRAVGMDGTRTPDGQWVEYEWEVGFVDAPVVNITSALPGTENPETGIFETTDKTATFEFALEQPDPAYRFSCTLSGSALDQALAAFCDSPKVYENLAPGTYTFEVEPVSPYLFVDAEPAVWEWTVLDVDAPDTFVDSGPAQRTGSTQAELVFRGVDNSVEDLDFECSLNGADFEPCSNPLQLSSLEPGSYTVAVRAVDESGNVDPTPATYTWRVVGAPQASISSGPDPEVPTTEATATFEFTSDADEQDVTDVTFECSLNGADFEPCASPYTVEDLAADTHTLEVRALISELELVGESVEWEWTVELPSAPQTTIVAGPDSKTAVDTATFEFVSDQENSTFECSLNGESWTACASPHTVFNLAQREHVFEVRARNEHGVVDQSPAEYKWEVDLPPTTEIISGPAERTASTTATFRVTSNEAPNVSYECSLDPDAGLDPADYSWGSCPTSNNMIVFENLQPGEHTVWIRAKDSNNVDPNPASYSWTIIPLPTVAIDEEAEGFPQEATDQTTATFTFSSPDNPDASFECIHYSGNDIDFDEADFRSCTSPKTYTDLAFGEHEFYVRAVDAEDNKGPWVSYDWDVGEILGEVTITSAPDTVTESRSATFEFSAEKSDGTPVTEFKCWLSGPGRNGNETNCASPTTYTGLQLGEYTLKVQAYSPHMVDVAGETEFTWTVADLTPPETTINLNPPNPGGHSAIFTFSSSETGSQFECSLDGAPFTQCNPNGDGMASYFGLEPGEHTFEVRAIDTAGNIDPTPASYTWTVLSVPELEADPAEVTASSATVSFRVANVIEGEPAATFECELITENGSMGQKDCTSPVTFNDLQPGDYTLEIVARNAAGDLSEVLEVEWTIEADQTPPEVTITSAPAAETTSTSATFEFQANEAGSTFECSLDGADFAECASPVTLEDLAVGEHTFEVRATDSAGNEGDAVSHTWTVTAEPDTTPPVAAIASQPDATTSATSAEFAFESNEPGSEFRCSLDGAAPDPCTSPQSYSGLAVGEHTFSVFAIDAAGNEGEPVSYSWTVQPPADTTPPEVTIDAKPDATTSSTSASFEFSADEDATFECRLDGGDWSECSSPKEYSDLAVGEHTFRVRAIDPAGNVSEPVSHTWTIQASCSAQTLTASAAADTWVLESSATKNHATDSILKVESKNRANSRALVRFNLPAVPSGCEVKSAQLRLYSSSGKSNRTLQAFRLGGSWTETGATWANQPATAGAAATAPSRANAGWVEWSVAEQVGAMYGGANNGFLIRDASDGNNHLQSFHSKENSSNRPQLVITVG